MADRYSTTEVINLTAEFESDFPRVISIPNPISFNPTVTEGIETSELGSKIASIETLVKENNLLIGDKNSSAFVRFTNPVTRVSTQTTVLGLDLDINFDDDGDIDLYGDVEEANRYNISMLQFQLFYGNNIVLPDDFTNSSPWQVPIFDNNSCLVANDDIFSNYLNSTLPSNYCLQIVSQEGVVSTYSLEGVAVKYKSGTDNDDYDEYNYILMSQSVLPVGCIFRLCAK